MKRRRYISTPQLVKINQDKFLLMWTEAPDRMYSERDVMELKYVFLDGSGNATSKIYSAKAGQSDCQPVVKGNKVVWYVTDNSQAVFYSIDLSNPETVSENK